MSNHIEAELLAFHFGELEVQQRDAVEAHLRECLTCVDAYLQVKRHVELADSSVRPGAAARARLRQAVKAHVAPPRARWERPLAFVLAAMVVLLAASAVGHLSRLELPHSGAAQVR